MTTVTTETDTETDTAEARLEAFVGRMTGEFATAAAMTMVELGDRLGLYRVLAEAGPTTEAGLAEITGYNPRLVAEWLRSQAANQLADFHPADGTYALNPEASAMLADPRSPVYFTGAVNIITSMYRDIHLIEAAFRGDGGVDWGGHDGCMYSGVEKFFATAYNNSLVAEWIPALDGVEEKLALGASVADIGCGHGISTALLAETYPSSTLTGVDPHAESIERARTVARGRGVTIDYRTETAAGLTGGPYDLICFFDCLHDMGDPDAAIRRAREQLAPDGTVMLVELHADDDLVAGFAHPFSRWFYAASVALCTPAALAQGGEALGNQVGTAAWRKRFLDNGFGSFREVIRTPFNLVLEARP